MMKRIQNLSRRWKFHHQAAMVMVVYCSCWCWMADDVQHWSVDAADTSHDANDYNASSSTFVFQSETTHPRRDKKKESIRKQVTDCPAWIRAQLDQTASSVSSAAWAYQMIAVSALSYYNFHQHYLQHQHSSSSSNTNVNGSSSSSSNNNNQTHTHSTTDELPLQFGLKRTKNGQGIRHKLGQWLAPATVPWWYQHQQKNHYHHDTKTAIQLQYFLFQWHESGVAGVRFHDTDVLLSTIGPKHDLVVTFRGTSEPYDHVTNLQTFEPARHSQIYSPKEQQAPEGSLHRGFLNAYHRVHRGSILRLSSSLGPHHRRPRYWDDWDRRFGHCAFSSSSNKSNNNNNRNSTTGTYNNTSSYVRHRRQGNGCYYAQSGDVGLADLLRPLLQGALRQGRTVHVTGHSLGGGLANHVVLDLLRDDKRNENSNQQQPRQPSSTKGPKRHRKAPLHRLHLWTFGAPQIADALFFQNYVSLQGRHHRSFVVTRQVHRYVTVVTDANGQCQMDLVVNVTQRTLPSHEDASWHGQAARTLGGVTDSMIVHWGPAHYLHVRAGAPKATATRANQQQQQEELDGNNNQDNNQTLSALDAHMTAQYLRGIAQENQRSHHDGRLFETTLPHLFQVLIGEKSAYGGNEKD